MKDKDKILKELEQSFIDLGFNVIFIEQKSIKSKKKSKIKRETKTDQKFLYWD